MVFLSWGTWCVCVCVLGNNRHHATREQHTPPPRSQTSTHTTPPKNNTHTYTPPKNNTHTRHPRTTHTHATQEEQATHTTPPKNKNTHHASQEQHHTTATKNNTHHAPQERHTHKMLIFLIVVAIVSTTATFEKKKTRSVRSCFFFSKVSES